MCGAIIAVLLGIFFWSLRPHVAVSRTGFEHVGWVSRWSAEFAEIDRVDLNARLVSARGRYLEYRIVLYRGEEVLLKRRSTPDFMAYIAARLSVDTDCFINLPNERREAALQAIEAALARQPLNFSTCALGSDAS